MANEPGDVTLLLQGIRKSEDKGLRKKLREELFAKVEGELRKIALARLPPQSEGHSLHATVLIHEAFVRLVVEGNKSVEDRKEFYRIASGVMRRILVDHFRRRRPDNIDPDRLGEVPAPDGSTPDKHLRQAERLLALDSALNRLREQDEEAADLFELYFFGGLRLSLGATPEEWIVHVSDNKASLEEIAAAIGISRAKAYRIMHRAKTFLQRELQGLI
jgi:RNA polymerase sigma factor (TIGR02999 family)